MAHKWSSLQLITYNVTYIIADFTPKISGRNHMLNSKNKSLPLLLNEHTSVWHKLTYQYFFQQHILENVSEKFDLNRTRPFANIPIKIYLTKNNAMSYLYFFRWIGYILIENTSFTFTFTQFLIKYILQHSSEFVGYVKHLSRREDKSWWYYNEMKSRFSVPKHPLLPPLHCNWAMWAYNAQRVAGMMVVLDMNDAGWWIDDSQVSRYQLFNWCQQWTMQHQRLGRQQWDVLDVSTCFMLCGIDSIYQRAILLLRNVSMH